VGSRLTDYQKLRERVLTTIYDDDALWEKCWPYTDAYGPEGYMPPQGYDWSGFRDSSPAAIKRMAECLGLTTAEEARDDC
jgi:hypothetical protein